MENTKIEWADHTFNPWVGCTKVSPACDHCYAQVQQDHRYGRVKWGAGNPRSRTSKANWRKPLAWNRQAEAAGTRPFVFCASLADVFDNEVAPDWRADLIELITQTPQLVWLLLTKRIGNVTKMVEALPGNVAVGATMANQNEYDRDAWKLLDVKEKLRPLFTFGSFEPLLGPISIDRHTAPDWIIVGGESGRGARPMDLDWARQLRDECNTCHRVFNFKQTGAQVGHGSELLDGQRYFARPDIAKCERQRNFSVQGDTILRTIIGQRAT
jgi:protein gp37